ncbi:MAG: ribonuclease domain-containing protein [Burkholderiales bacterium]
MNFFRLVIAVLIFLGGTSVAFCRDDPSKLAEISVSALPPEGRDTLVLIKKGGPYPYQRDGVVFGNFEKLLPARARGYYSEFTVPTPGAKTRGARRIVAGKDGEFFYTDDHYKSFKRVRE